MTFTSTAFLAFCAVFFPIYYLTINRLQLNNLVVATASLLFYGWYQPWFVGVMLVSAVTDYSLGLIIFATEEQRKRRLLLIFSIVLNVGFLGYFKYTNFIVDSLNALAGAMHGGKFDFYTNVVLPAGISFYTFQSMSYTIDVYRGHLKPTRSFVSFLCFVSFFPHLVAGPIMRSTALLPQVQKRRRFVTLVAEDGIRQILWGFAKKVIVADNLARAVDLVYSSPQSYSSPSLVVATVFFAFQIYADFSAYSDIANGLAKMLGFQLIQNFRMPYFAVNIVDFWRRWHISLTSWFRDYIYLPLGGSRVETPRCIFNIIVVFLVSGLWHGANWTFVAWGGIHALAYTLFALKNGRHGAEVEKSGVAALVARLTTFGFVCVTWVFFRAVDMTTALSILGRMLSPSDWRSKLPHLNFGLVYQGVALIIGLLIIEWWSRHCEFPLSVISRRPLIRRVVYTVVMLAIIFLGAKNEVGFIYFQF